uniref:Uncharacterized protein n=1 Tax=Myoviridae sp. ctzyI3 TaxID=2826722 RepID=A0A8S5MM19_9CAUD|nr:MAG TPA: hypothetical protein [Myoviridae sp. ctzyI3]
MIRKRLELYPLIRYTSISFIFNYLIISILYAFYVYLPMF